jgi:hypothetical protein
MANGRHASGPPRPSRDYAVPRRRAMTTRYSWLAMFAAFAVLLLTVGRHVAANYEGAAALNPAACPTAPELAGSTSAVTLFGSNASNPSALAQATSQFGHMPIIRIFFQGLPAPNAWTSGSAAVNRSAVVVSFNAPPSTILSGADDGALSHFFDSAPTGETIYWNYEHEPEHYVDSGQFTTAQYRAAFAHLISLANAAHNPYLRSTLILTSWTLSPQSGRNWKDFMPAGINVLGWDDYPPGTIGNHNPQATPPADFMASEIAAGRSVGLPVGFPEFALATSNGRPAWLNAVGNYLMSQGALFGIYFDAPGAGQMTDASSIAAWRGVIAHSGLGVNTPAATPAASPSQAPPTPAPTPTPTVTQQPKPSPPTTSGPVITNANVRPGSFTPGNGSFVKIQFKVSEEAATTICVLDSNGAVQRRLDNTDQPAGWASSWYYGHGQQGKLLAPGVYTVVIVARNVSGTATAWTSVTVTG